MQNSLSLTKMSLPTYVVKLKLWSNFHSHARKINSSEPRLATIMSVFGEQILQVIFFLIHSYNIRKESLNAGNSKFACNDNKIQQM